MIHLSENLLSMRDVAAFLNVSYETVRCYRQKGVRVGARVAVLNMQRVGRQYRISREGVQQFLEQMNPESRPAATDHADEENARRALEMMRLQHGV